MHEFSDVEVRFHGVHLMGYQLNILLRVALVGVDAINARIRRHVPLTFRESEGHPGQGTDTFLSSQHQGKEVGINVVGDLVFPGTQPGAARDEREVVFNPARVVTSLLVLRAALSRTGPARETQTAALPLVEVLRSRGEHLATDTARAVTVVRLSPHHRSLLDEVITPTFRVFYAIPRTMPNRSGWREGC
jgi:hypothetical protein